MYHYLHLNPLV
ncbi:hypothetical protein DERF_002349 [Dermatophagoides farinae]|uniref:Uncharacterized protein n=1 Tax=Dermatophagoides farinae TaxID=6954 RepID=A0A922LAE1_DERFA|nr:hypothetical protein DERF_002349 [Dermatophagoides farinae]